MTLYELMPLRKNRKNGNSQDPLATMDRLHRSLFDDFFGDFAIEPFGAFNNAQGAFVPKVNLTEDENNVYVSAELPGLEEKDIELSLTDNQLTIKGEKKQHHEEKETNYYRQESAYGSFQRIIGLPSEVNADKSEAKFANGLLEIKLPRLKPEVTKAKKINIKSGK